MKDDEMQLMATTQGGAPVHVNRNGINAFYRFVGRIQNETHRAADIDHVLVAFGAAVQSGKLTFGKVREDDVYKAVLAHLPDAMGQLQEEEYPKPPMIDTKTGVEDGQALFRAWGDGLAVFVGKTVCLRSGWGPGTRLTLRREEATGKLMMREAKEQEVGEELTMLGEVGRVLLTEKMLTAMIFPSSETDLDLQIDIKGGLWQIQPFDNSASEQP